MGFQEPASQSMRDIVWFHDYMLLPIIVAISVFVLFLMAYAMIRFRASRNPNPSKRTHNVAVEILWTLIPCLILIVMAVPSFKILYSQDTIPKADVTIKAVGYQWYWGYEYLDEKGIEQCPSDYPKFPSDDEIDALADRLIKSMSGER